MTYKKKTLRNLPPKSRKYARLINELDSTSRRLKNLLTDIRDAELAERAMFNQQKHTQKPSKEALDEGDTSPLFRPAEGPGGDAIET